MRAAGARRWKSLGDVVLARRFAGDASTGPWGHDPAPVHYGSSAGGGGEGVFAAAFVRQGDGEQGTQHTAAGKQHNSVHGSPFVAGNVRQGEGGYGFPYPGAVSQELGAGRQGDGVQGFQNGAGDVRRGQGGQGLSYGAGTQLNAAQHPGVTGGAQGSLPGTGNVRHGDSGYGFPTAGTGMLLNGAQHPVAGRHSVGLPGTQVGAGNVEQANSGYGVPQFPIGGTFRSQLQQEGRGPYTPHQSGAPNLTQLRSPSDNKQYEATQSPQLQNGKQDNGSTAYASFFRPDNPQRTSSSTGSPNGPYEIGQSTSSVSSSFVPDVGQTGQKSPSLGAYERSSDSFGRLNEKTVSPYFPGIMQQTNVPSSVSNAQNDRLVDGRSNSSTQLTSNGASEYQQPQPSSSSSNWRIDGQVTTPNPAPAYNPSSPVKALGNSSFSSIGRNGDASQYSQAPESFQGARGFEPRSSSFVPSNGYSQPAYGTSPPLAPGGQGISSSPPLSSRFQDGGNNFPTFAQRSQLSESQQTSSLVGGGQSQAGSPSNFTGIHQSSLSHHTDDQLPTNPVPSARPHESGRSTSPFIQDVVKGLSRSASEAPPSEQSIPPVPQSILQAGVPRKVLARLSNFPRFILKSDIISYFEDCKLKEEDLEFLYDDKFRLRFIHVDFDSEDSFERALKTKSAKGRLGGKFIKLEQDAPIELDEVNVIVQSLRGHGLLMQNLSNEIVREDLDRFFQGYDLGTHSIRFLRSSSLVAWRNAERRAIVQFDSYLSASRALRERQGQFCGGKAVELRYLQ